MRLGRGFFEVQVCFAERVAALSGQPILETLLTHTNLYVRFGLGRGFDPHHPRWQRYLAGLEGHTEFTAWTQKFYLDHARTVAVPGFQARFGCFSYGLLGGNRARLHFHADPSSPESPLNKAGIVERKHELQRLAAHVKQHVGAHARIVGASWLYNIPAYRRLFPPAYLQTAQVRSGGFQFMPLWGQFIDRNGEVRADVRHTFLSRLAAQTDPSDLDAVFAWRVLELEAAVGAFDGNLEGQDG